MSKKQSLGAFALIAFIGFLLGVAAYFIYFEGLPILINIFPQILEVTWVVWGLIGAILAVICILIYAYFPED